MLDNRKLADRLSKYSACHILFIFGLCFLVLGVFSPPSIFAQSNEKLNKSLTAYKRFVGKVAGQRVEAHLHFEGDEVYGIYMYTKYKEPINLVTKIPMNAKGNFVLTEAYYPDQKGMPIWKVNFEDGKLTGRWRHQDKNYEIDLHEQYGEGTHAFDYQVLRDTLFYAKNTEEEGAFSVLYAFPTTVHLNFKKKIKEILNFDKTISFEAGFAKNVKELFEKYQVDLEDFSQEMGGAKWHIHKQVFIDYNENDVVVVRLNSSGYLGGAHGYNDNSIIVWDMQSNRRLKLTDVLTIDPTVLGKMIYQNLLRKQTQSGNAEMKGFFVKDYIEPNPENWGVDQKGIYFIYNAYELAGYSSGNFKIRIPFEDLQPFLKTDYSSRLNKD